MDKVVMVDDVEYEEKILCHHVNTESCFNVYRTQYKPKRHKECTESFRKDCTIVSEEVTVPLVVNVCEETVQRTCAEGPGEIVAGSGGRRQICSVEFVSGG